MESRFVIETRAATENARKSLYAEFWRNGHGIGLGVSMADHNADL